MSMADRDGWIWYDGKMVPWREATTHVLTHTLHYGMGVFEGVRCYKTVDGPAIFRLRDHTNRLFNSAHIYGMKIPFTKEEIDAAQIACVARQQARLVLHPADRVLRLARAGRGGEVQPGARCDRRVAVGRVSRRRGDRDAASASRRPRSRTITRTSRCATPRRSATTRCPSSRTRRRCTTATKRRCCSTRRASCARDRARTCSSCATACWHTPDLGSGALNGITRDCIITFARELGIPVQERRITRDEVYIADEAFFTGTAAEVTPIRELDNRTIGSGRARSDDGEAAGPLLRGGQRPHPGEEALAHQSLTQ